MSVKSDLEAQDCCKVSTSFTKTERSGGTLIYIARPRSGGAASEVCVAESRTHRLQIENTSGDDVHFHPAYGHQEAK